MVKWVIYLFCFFIFFLSMLIYWVHWSNKHFDSFVSKNDESGIEYSNELKDQHSTNLFRRMMEAANSLGRVGRIIIMTTALTLIIVSLAFRAGAQGFGVV